MPVAQYKPDVPVAPVTIPKIQGVENKSVVVDAKYQPLQSLVTYVEGMAYTVNFYAQVLSADSAVTGHDPGQMGQYDQRKRIDGLVIKLTQPLQPDQNAEDKMFSVRGAGHIASAVIPNEGDMFVADVGDGREGVFQLTSSQRMSVMQDTVYFVEFSLLFFSDQNKKDRDDLEAKVVQHLHYVQDFVQTGNSPLVTTNEYAALRELREWHSKLVGYYFDWFYSREYATFLVPYQTLPTYDHFVVDMLRQILDTRDHHMVVRMRQLNVNDADHLRQPQLYRALLERDHDMLSFCNKLMHKARVENFQYDPFMEGIRYTGIVNLVYPIESYTRTADQGYNTNADLKPVTGAPFDDASSLGGNTNLLVTSTGTPVPEFPPIHNVLVDPFYVFSRAFYEGTTGKSQLEVYTENYLQLEPNDPVKILELVKACRKWGAFERFYYIPILLILIRTLVKEM